MSVSTPAPARARVVLIVLLALVSSVLVTGLPASRAEAADFSQTGFSQTVLDEAARHQGKPYRYGATGPDAFDCSGFTGYVYGRLGITIPRTSRDQYAALPKVAQGDRQPGDLIFNYNSGGIYHVGIYAGGDRMWAAPRTGDHVRLQTMWTSQYLVARPVPDLIRQHWISLGGNASVVGRPLGGEFGVPGGRKTDYASGDIYWSPGTGAREVHGAVVQRYDALGGSAGSLGHPVSDELPVPGGAASRFLGGALFFTPGVGVSKLQGAILHHYDSMGGSGGVLGVPVTDELVEAGGRRSVFHGGGVWWSPTSGAHAVYGAIGRSYLQRGGAAGPVGFPLSEERDAPGGRESVFQNGVLRWERATGTVSWLPR